MSYAILHDYLLRPTVSLGVTSAVVCTYGCDDGRISPTRCAIIDAGLDGRCRLRRTRRTPPAAARSVRNAEGSFHSHTRRSIFLQATALARERCGSCGSV